MKATVPATYYDFVEQVDNEAIVDLLQNKDEQISKYRKKITMLNKKISRLVYHLQDVEMYNPKYIKDIMK